MEKWKRQMEELPKGWVKCSLPESCDLIMGQSPPSSTYNTNGIGLPFYQGKTEFGELYPTPEKYCSEPNKIAEKGDILISIRAPVGPTNISPHQSCIGRGLTAIRPLNKIKSKFILYLFRNIEPIISKQGTGTTFKAITKDFLTDLELNLPPLPEQHRIVAKIEELFSDLDNGIEQLKTAQQQLKVYRQAVLKWAFEGKLTNKWRETHHVEPAERLLEQIKTARENRYQQLEDWQLAIEEWETNGSQGGKPARPQKPKELPPLSEDELAELPKLPEGWFWVRLGELTWSVKDGPHYSPKYAEHGIPFITGGNVRPSGVDFLNVKYITPELYDELSKRCKPELGDILYTKGGTTGIARVNTYNFEFNVWVHVAVLKTVESIDPFYLQHALNSPFCHSQSQKFTHGVGNQDLGLTRMVNIVLAFCNKEEQHQIVQDIETRLSICDNIEVNITDVPQVEF